MSFAVDFGASRGLGLRDNKIPAAWHSQLLVAEYTAIVLFNPALMATKTSILLLYLDIARDSQKFLRIGCYVTLAVVNVGGVILTFITAFQCRPVEAAYNVAIKNPSCISIETIYLASAPVNVTTDLAILVLPISVLTTLSLPLRQKTILISAFIVGVIFVTVVDVARICSLQMAATSLDTLPSTKLTTSLDFSYNASMALLWSAVEVNVAIVGACYPTLRPFLKRIVPKMLSNWTRHSGAHELVQSSSSQGGSNNSQSRNETLRQPSSATSPATVDLQSGSIAQPTENQEQQRIMRGLLTSPEPEISVLGSELPPFQHSEHSTSLGFINMGQPKCILDMRGTESLKYCALAATLLAVEGITTVMLFSVNGEIPIVGNETQGVGISSALYGGGFFSPLLGYLVLHRVGFKATFVTALGVCCIGTLMFWPSGALLSYPGFIVSSFVVGISLALMDLSSNCFLTLCGPPQFAEIRVLLGQGVAALTGTLSSLLSQKVIFVNVRTGRSLIALQWAYLAIALFTVFLGLVFYYIPLPEATESDLRSRGDRLWIEPSQKYFGRLPVIFVTLAIAVLSGFCGGAALVCFRNFIGDVMSSISTSTHTSPSLSPSDFQTVVSAVYTAGHFIAAVLCLFVPPRALLLWAYACGITFSALIMRLKSPSINSVESMSLIFAIFFGPIPNLVIAIGLRGSGTRTKLATCLLESSINLGCCVFPPIMLAVLRAFNQSDQYSFCVLIALFAIGMAFPLYLNLVRAARVPGHRLHVRQVTAKVIQQHCFHLEV
jgi:fucose permease